MHHIKFGCGLLMLANFPTSNRIEVLSPDVFGYFITGGGEGTVDNIIFIKNGSKKTERQVVQSWCVGFWLPFIALLVEVSSIAHNLPLFVTMNVIINWVF